MDGFDPAMFQKIGKAVFPVKGIMAAGIMTTARSAWTWDFRNPAFYRQSAAGSVEAACVNAPRILGLPTGIPAASERHPPGILRATGKGETP